MRKSHIYILQKWSIIEFVYIGLDLLTNTSVYKLKKGNTDPFSIQNKTKTKLPTNTKIYTE